MARVNVRCSKETCKLRYVFSRHPDEYLRPRKCLKCGGTKFRVIPNMRADRGKSTPCDCGAYRWTDKGTAIPPSHRMGSGACWYNTDGSMREISEEEYAAA